MYRNILKSNIRKIINTWRNRNINNVFKKNYNKKVLLSYITMPFKKQSLAHTNYFEAKSIASIFDELGYIVDVVEYTKEKFINLDDYDVIIGFGDVFKSYFENYNKSVITIYYGAGMHVCHQNTATLNRLKDVYVKKKVWLTASARYVEKTWSHQTTLVDGIIALGNKTCATTYANHYTGKIFAVPAPCYVTQDALNILNSRSLKANKSFLWFGSVGLVHKGLDLLLDYFSKNSNLQLHICGAIDSEKDFVTAYKKELYGNSNIHVHGFIDIKSIKFRNILAECNFTIFPSCSEGGCPSVAIAVMNGALIPIVSKETSFSTGSEIVIETLDAKGISAAIDKALGLSQKELVDLQLKNYNYVKLNNSQSNYYHKLKESIENIIYEI